jgi:cytochrome b561
MNGSPGTFVMILLVPLIGWRLYRRMRRLVGRQPSRTWRHAFSVAFLPLVLTLLALGAWLAHREDTLLALAGGIAVGAGLALWGLRLTRFEKTDDGWFYTPNARIGIALMALLVVRLVYRAFELVGQSGLQPPNASQDMMRSPLTMVMLGAVLSYYAAYSAGLLRWRLSAR